MYSRRENELVIQLHVLALGKHPIFIIKSEPAWVQTSGSPPDTQQMVKATATNWFPSLLFVKGRTQQSTSSIKLSRISEWNKRVLVLSHTKRTDCQLGLRCTSLSLISLLLSVFQWLIVKQN